MSDLRDIPISDLVVDRANPRRDPRPSADLVASIIESGIIEPLVVRPNEDRFGVICGSRRLAASKDAGLDTVPCVVREDITDDAVALAMGLQENAHRSDMDPIEEAFAYEDLLDEYGWTLEQAAKSTGVSVPTVRGRLQLLTLPEEVQDRVAAGTLTIKGALKFASSIGRTQPRTAAPKRVDLDAVDAIDPGEVEPVGKIAGSVEVAVPADIWRAVTTAASMADVDPGPWLVGAIRDRIVREKAHKASRQPTKQSRGSGSTKFVNSRPLIKLVESRGGLAAVLAHIDAYEESPARRAYYRAKSSGRISVGMADQLAKTLLGLTATEVWGQEWTAA